MLFILNSCFFSQIISIYHNKSHNFLQVCIENLATSYYWICCFYLIGFTLSLLLTWNNMKTDTNHNSQTDWHTDSNSETNRVLTHNSQIVSLAIRRLSSHRLANARLTFQNQFNLGCVSTVTWILLCTILDKRLETNWRN